jgi:hypothetical protein
MDFFTGFNNLKPSIRTILLVILVKMPFWYLAIVIFSGSFAAHYPFYIHLVAAFCLSMAWLYGMSFAMLSIEKLDKENSTNGFNESFYESAVVLTLPILCLATFFTYIMKWHFMDFVIIAFGLLAGIIVFAIIGQIGIYLLSKIKKSRQK